MTARESALIVGKGVVLAIAVGVWAFAYHWLALGACVECSVAAAVTYAVVISILGPVTVLWLLRSSWGRLRIYLRWFHRPSRTRVLVAGVVTGLVVGLTVFGATGSPWRIAPVLLAWVVFYLTFPKLLSVLFGRDVGLR